MIKELDVGREWSRQSASNLAKTVNLPDVEEVFALPEGTPKRLSAVQFEFHRIK